MFVLGGYFNKGVRCTEKEYKEDINWILPSKIGILKLYNYIKETALKTQCAFLANGQIFLAK